MVLGDGVGLAKTYPADPSCSRASLGLRGLRGMLQKHGGPLA